MSHNNTRAKLLKNSANIKSKASGVNYCFGLVSFSIRGNFQTLNVSFHSLKDHVLNKLNISEITNNNVEIIFKELDLIRNNSITLFVQFSNYRKIKKIEGNRNLSKKDFIYLGCLQLIYISIIILIPAGAISS